MNNISGLKLPGGNARSLAYALLVITAVLWSSGGLFIKLVSWPAPAVAGGRSLIAAICFSAYLRRFPNTLWAWLAALAYALCLSTFVMATKLGPAANAIVLQYTGPLHAAWISSWLLGERIKRYDLFCLPLAFAGVLICLCGSLNEGTVLGTAFGIITGFFFGLMIVLLRKVEQHSESCIAVGNLLTALLLIPYLGDLEFSFQNTSSILVLGILQIALAYYLFARALRNVDAVEATMFTLLEPVLNPIWVALILKEQTGVASIGGGIVVLFALVYRTLLSNRELSTGAAKAVDL